MLAIVGTVPDENFPIAAGPVMWSGIGQIQVQGQTVPISRGTPALLAAAASASQALNLPMPFAFVSGDIGLGNGSRRLYAYIEHHLSEFQFQTIAFHYLIPDVDWHMRVLFAIQKMNPHPILIADAGFMYAAKMSGQAEEYDLFTPDAGEMAFLADEEAPHPFYTRGFILHEENRIPDLISRAYAHHNCAKNLLVKGQKDYVVRSGKIANIIDAPEVPPLEAIGGTGDTLTGIAAALSSSGMEIGEASALAAHINRLAGYYAHPTPATQISEIIGYISKALTDILFHPLSVPQMELEHGIHSEKAAVRHSRPAPFLPD